MGSNQIGSKSVSVSLTLKLLSENITFLVLQQWTGPQNDANSLWVISIKYKENMSISLFIIWSKNANVSTLKGIMTVHALCERGAAALQRVDLSYCSQIWTFEGCSIPPKSSHHVSVRPSLKDNLTLIVSSVLNLIHKTSLIGLYNSHRPDWRSGRRHVDGWK